MSSNLLYSEIFQEFDKATTREDRVKILQKNGDARFKDFLVMALNPYVKFDIVPPTYRPAIEPAGLNFAYLDTEMPKMYRFISNHPKRSGPIPDEKQKQLLVVILEALHKDEAALLVKVFQKDLGVKYLTPKICKEAFPDIDIPV
jgi:hypothetical protein